MSDQTGCMSGQTSSLAWHNYDRLIGKSYLQACWMHVDVKVHWFLQEDDKVVELVRRYGPKRWSLIAQHLKGRIGKQCRERYVCLKSDYWSWNIHFWSCFKIVEKIQSEYYRNHWTVSTLKKTVDCIWILSLLTWPFGAARWHNHIVTWHNVLFTDRRTLLQNECLRKNFPPWEINWKGYYRNHWTVTILSNWFPTVESSPVSSISGGKFSFWSKVLLSAKRTLCHVTNLAAPNGHVSKPKIQMQ